MNEEYLVDYKNLEQKKNRRLIVYGLFIFAIIGSIFTIIYFDNIQKQKSLFEEKVAETLNQQNKIEALEKSAFYLEAESNKLRTIIKRQDSIIKILNVKLKNNNISHNTTATVVLPKYQAIDTSRSDSFKDAIIKSNVIIKTAPIGYSVKIIDSGNKNSYAKRIETVLKKSGFFKLVVTSNEMPINIRLSRYDYVILYKNNEDLKTAELVQAEIYNNLKIKANLRQEQNLKNEGIIYVFNVN